MLDKLWVEKYEPKQIKHVLGNEELLSKVQEYIDKGDIPNLMFWGSSGTGKGTITKIICSNLDCEYMRINGSDENGVDMVRDKIGTFVSSVSFKKFRIVVIDEFDFISVNAQAVLRNMIESSYKNARFIVTLNYPNRIIEPLHSRFQEWEVKPIDTSLIEKRMFGILKKEEIKFEDDDVVEIVKSCYPDVRKTIQTIQQYSIDGELKISSANMLNDEYKLQLVKMIKDDTKFETIRQLVINSSNIDYVSVYKMLFDCVDDYCNNKDNKSDILLDIAEHLYRDVDVVDKEINLSACIIKILKHNK